MRNLHPNLLYLAIVVVSCGGRAERDSGAEPSRESGDEPGDLGMTGSGASGVDGTTEQEPMPADLPGPDPDPPATGGATSVSEEPWCPVDDEWDLVLGEDHMGGAPAWGQCPQLPATSLSMTYCVYFFSDVEPIDDPDSDSCCYRSAGLHCR